jgi:hypothetical protein
VSAGLARQQRSQDALGFSVIHVFVADRARALAGSLRGNERLVNAQRAQSSAPQAMCQVPRAPTTRAIGKRIHQHHARDPLVLRGSAERILGAGAQACERQIS